MKHFIVTKYNLSMYTPSKYNRPGIDKDKWMSERIKLFSNVTVPSIRSQSCKDFRWLVFVDPLTPQHFKDQLEALKFENMELVYDNQHRSLLLERVRELGGETVITSRIDNDDAFDYRYVEYIQKNFNKPRALVDFTDQCWFDLEGLKAYIIRKRWYRYHKFLWRLRYLIWPPVTNAPTMVEVGSKAKTVLCKMHHDLPKAVAPWECKLVNGQPWVLVTCHKTNVINQINSKFGQPEQVDLSILRNFNIDIEQLL